MTSYAEFNQQVETEYNTYLDARAIMLDPGPALDFDPDEEYELYLIARDQEELIH